MRSATRRWIAAAAGALALPLPLALAPRSSASESAAPSAVEFAVLSYNTHGLPGWIAGDAPERRFPRIGALAQRYDVVLFQEDFRFHAELAHAAEGMTLLRGNPSRFRASALCLLFCDGSGLAFGTRLPREAVLSATNRPYGACNGWAGAANDCLATKGFQDARVLLGGQFEIHVVNTHLDAGRSPDDRAARKAQLASLQEYLEREAAGAALVLGGDLNLEARDPADAALRDAFAEALHLTSTGAAAREGSDWERLDYLYVRDGGGIVLQVLDAGEAIEFVDENGAPLSDHPAIFARLRARPLF